MAKIDREVDELYQLPLAEFTSARDALAKRSEADRAAIKRLEKPNLPAWAVNQLYWRERGAYDALVASAERLRKMQMAALSGKSADVGAAEGEHATARKIATDRVRKILADAGENSSPATIAAINETLDALPAGETPGRLVRPLKPPGFEALSGLMKGGKIAPRRADVLPFRTQPASARAPGKEPTAKQRAADVREAKRHAEQAKKERAARAAELREAERAEQAATTALAKMRASLAKTQRDREQTEQRLEALGVELDRVRRELRDSERRLADAKLTREALQQQ